MNIYNCCCLCLEEDKNNGDNLIWNDGMQLCESCYNNYIENDYYKKIMTINAIKRYRRKIEELEKENKEIRQWKYVIDTYADLEKLKELDLIKIEEKEYISKNKIREKIKELSDGIYDAKIILQQLLEE